MKKSILYILLLILIGCTHINNSPPFAKSESNQPKASIKGGEPGTLELGLFSIDGSCFQFDGPNSECYMSKKNTAFVLTGIRTVNVSCFSPKKYSNVDIVFNVEDGEEYVISCTRSNVLNKVNFRVIDKNGNKIEVKVKQIDLTKN